jgi:hypothetical protein
MTVLARPTSESFGEWATRLSVARRVVQRGVWKPIPSMSGGSGEPHGGPSKTVTRHSGRRGFESLPLRWTSQIKLVQAV